MKTSAQKISSVLNNLKTSSYKELQQTIKAINKELRSGAVARNTDEWKQLNKYLRQCRNQLNFIKEEGKTTEPWFKRIPKFFNDNWGVITQAIGSLTGLSLTVRKCVSEFTKMDDVMANTRKYTGMTDESVRELNEDFKGMNTRTSREQLNEFAGAAYFGASPPTCFGHTPPLWIWRYRWCGKVNNFFFKLSPFNSKRYEVLTIRSMIESAIVLFLARTSYHSAIGS